MRKTSWFPWVAAAFTIFAARALAEAPANYQVIKKVKLQGDSGWDYLTIDAEARRLYVTRDTRVAVIDLDTVKEDSASIATDGAHGVAIARDLNRGFVSSGRANQVIIFDLATLKVLGKLPTEKKPDAIVYQPVSKRVLAFNGESHSVTVIDAAKATLVGTIKLDGKPEFAAAAPGGDVYVNIEDKSELAVIDPAAMAVRSIWQLSGCEDPSGLALDARHHRLFAACANQKMLVVDADKGKVVQTLPIGKGADAAGFDAERGLAFAPNGGDGTLTVVQQETSDRYAAVASVPTQKGARTMAIDPKTHRLYLVTADFAADAGGAEHKRRKIIPGSVVLLVVEPSSGG